ncbi:MAG: protein kinase [Gemmatimonadota bacterium]|nr:MAG: protein kinase [Gemmatimonadota bacterium]
MTELLSRLQSSLANVYQIERELGEGGMAVVFLATDLKHNRRVAIKVLKPELSESLGGDRFLKEIETAAGLSHPHILTVHDSGDVGGLLYYVMPFVEGESLRDRIDREQQLPIDDALAICKEVGEALAHAHSVGIVHRDIKPENVLLYGGHAVIADFGIAKAVSAAGGEQLTATGIAVGTPSYMSPEQAAGDKVDARSDIYALACLTYEMLAGQPPFTGRNVQSLVQQHIAAPPPDVSHLRSSVNPEIAAAIQRAMAKAPADRFAKATEYVAALSGVKQPTGGGLTWSGLVRRRVPHVLGAYVLAAIFVVLAVDFAVNRFVLSPHLTNFVLVGLASLLPAVALIAYDRGLLASARSRALKLGVVANLVVTAAVLWLAFGAKDLGAATRRVVVQDEDGNSVERVVPKSAFRKRLAMYPFANEARDSATDWLQYGIPLATGIDLAQDLFIHITEASHMGEDFRRSGYPTGLNMPLTLMRQIADQRNLPYFVTGSFASRDTAIDATIRLYETRRAKLLSERHHSGSTVFSLADEVSAALKYDLGIPKNYIEEVEDLPVADRLTSSVPAYRDLVEAYRAAGIEQDWPAALAAIRASVEADPTNAMAHSIRYNISVLANDQAGAVQALEDAMRHIYKLPERAQYQTKFQYYDYRQEAEKALAVLEMWVDLLPDDIEGRNMYALVLSYRDRRPEAVEQYEKILEIDPTQTEYLQALGSLTQSMGEFDRATTYFERYVEEFPDNPESYAELGQLLRLQGRFVEAKATLERALLVDPENVVVLIELAALERRLGNLDAAMSGLHEVVEKTRTTQDTVNVWLALGSAYEYRGQIRQALEYRDRALTLAATYSPPLYVLRSRLNLLGAYVALGQESLAWQNLASLEQELQPPFDQIAAFGTLNIALESGDPDSVEAAADRIQDFIDAFGAEVLQAPVTHARARALEMRRQYGDAIEAFRRELDSTPSEISLHRDIGRCQRKLGDLDAAEASLEASLQTNPYSPKTHYELALVQEARGDQTAAVQHLETALEVWANADTIYKPAAEAREKLAQLRAGV